MSWFYASGIKCKEQNDRELWDWQQRNIDALNHPSPKKAQNEIRRLAKEEQFGLTCGLVFFVVTMAIVIMRRKDFRLSSQTKE